MGILNFLIFLPAILTVFVAAMTYIKFRDQIVDTGNIVSSEDLLLKRRLPPTVNLGGTNTDHKLLTAEYLRNGVDELALYIKTINPDWIAGVNFGGRLLSTYCVDKIGFPIDRCLFIRWDRKAQGHVFQMQKGLTPPNTGFGGRFLVLDDISRTGDTFAAIRSSVVASAHAGETDLERVYLASLIEVSDASGLRIRPDWSWRSSTKRYEVEFPWSFKSRQIGEALNNFLSTPYPDMVHSSPILAEFSLIGSDFQYALEIARSFLNQSEGSTSLRH